MTQRYSYYSIAYYYLQGSPEVCFRSNTCITVVTVSQLLRPCMFVILYRYSFYLQALSSLAHLLDHLQVSIVFFIAMTDLFI